ncbi:MAG: fumarylacetoacetate hydrolase family protein [Burkholderiales bacterium]|nr:fumarylacetoacetate hydrolase family protein [Burkholderiales bacterium]
MKLLRYSRKNEPAALARLGILVGDDLVADLRAGHALFLLEEKGNPKGEELSGIFMPPYLTQFLYLGEPGWEAVAETYAWMADLVRGDAAGRGLRGERLFLPLADCRLYAPVRPGKLIAVAHNYPDYAHDHGSRSASAAAAFAKWPSSITGPGRDILKPAATRHLDCATELAVVIGRKCKLVTPEKALESVAGYTILNDVTARDIAGREAAGGQMLLGKSFDTFSPLGPWLVTRDEIPDPMRLHIRTRVNGVLRQEGDTSTMVHSVAQLVAHLSQMTLLPGDVIATGSPGPLVSSANRPLVDGDMIDAEIEGIGVLRNAVVDAPA